MQDWWAALLGMTASLVLMAACCTCAATTDCLSHADHILWKYVTQLAQSLGWINASVQGSLCRLLAASGACFNDEGYHACSIIACSQRWAMHSMSERCVSKMLEVRQQKKIEVPVALMGAFC